MYSFPWDPKPEPAAKADATTLPSSVKPVSQALPSNGNVSTPPSSASTPGPQIKQEAQQYATQPPIQAKYAPQYNNQQPMTAQQRAAMHLQANFGDRAGTQIAQLQSGQQRVPSVSGGPIQPSPPYIKQEDGQQDEYRSNFPTSVPVKASQTDGSGDAREEYEQEIANRRVLIGKHRKAGDKLIRDHVLASQRMAEGGGLLAPLQSRESHRSSLNTGVQSNGNSSLKRAQGDATGDDDDEDAINSDLDDPADLEDNEDEEDNVSNVMLCTYDKVQRVKNKWKCTLKDGVLRVNDQE